MKRSLFVFYCLVFVSMSTVFGGFRQELAVALTVPEANLDQNDAAVLSKILNDSKMRQLVADYNFSLLLLEPNPEHFITVRESFAALMWSMLSLSAFIDTACQKTSGSEAVDNYLRQLRANLDQLKARVECNLGQLMLKVS